MTPGQIVSAVKDLLILLALAFVVYRVYAAGKDADLKQDMKEVMQQLKANAEQESKWRTASDQAERTRAAEIADIDANISANTRPVYIVQPAAKPRDSNSVSKGSTPASAQLAGAGGSDSGVGVNIRPGINAFEMKYEAAFADCRDLYAQWPQ